MKFEIGNTVKIVGYNHAYGSSVGKKGTIIDINEFSFLNEIIFHVKFHNGGDDTCVARDMKLIGVGKSKFQGRLF